ncbi:IclR family transcriptional regulator [Nocardia vinacea]|uniref:IclR family transcriptional regulator n=1 Tax=Nocardia vinacea TaxID=96468 RepID=UPI0034139066
MTNPVKDSAATSLPSRDPVAQRILVVLEACAAGKHPQTIMELVGATGLAKSTVHRMCWKLVELGLLEHSPDGFSIGTKVFALANANPIINEIRVAAIPYLVELQHLAGASNLAILTGHKALIVDGMYTRELRMVPLVGVGLPLHCTAVGKAIAARLDHNRREELLGPGLLPAATRRTIVHPALLRQQLNRIAEAGVGFSHEEFQLGTHGVAAGFRVRDDAIAAIGCVGRWNTPAISRFSKKITESALSLERELAVRA